MSHEPAAPADPVERASPAAHDREHGRTLRRAATASFIGNFIEWFDYASYGYLADVIGRDRKSTRLNSSH